MILYPYTITITDYKNVTLALSPDDHKFLSVQKEKQGVKSYSKVISNIIREYRELISHKDSQDAKAQETIDHLAEKVLFLEKEVMVIREEMLKAQKDLIEQNSKIVELLFRAQPPLDPSDDTNEGRIIQIEANLTKLMEIVNSQLKKEEKDQVQALLRAKEKLKE